MAWQLSASTVIINSIYDKEANPESVPAAAAVEDGLMDSLFDFGLIIFSTVNSSGLFGEGINDAGFIVTIEVINAENSVFYNLQSYDNREIIHSGIVDLSSISDNSDFEEKNFYYLLGMEVAQQLEQFFLNL